MLSEFDLIARYFTRNKSSRAALGRAALGIGDDCALFAPAPGMQLAVTSDMLVEGRHFFEGADPVALGHKALAVNLSDLAAMGAAPRAFTLALALPGVDADWLAGFSQGLFVLADAHDCELIGGDTTKGPLNICITAFGDVPVDQALRRDAARAGDEIWVSGSIGDARLALAALLNEVPLDDQALQAAAVRLHAPTPRVSLGLALRGIAHAAIDLSDGLIGDLGHILRRSGVGATVEVDALPFGPVLATQPQDVRRRLAASGGDDYELCFTAPPARHDAVLAAAESAGVAVTTIGRIDAASGLRLTDGFGAALDLSLASFDHFAQP